MFTDSLWVQKIDHRISTALILFLLLLLLGNGRRRRGFFLRTLGSLAVLCAASWVMRFVIDERLPTVFAQGMGYSHYICIMSLMYLSCYLFCYHADTGSLVYADLMALTIYKLAWNAFKVCSSGVLISAIPEIWSHYSPMGALVSYMVYGAVCGLTCFLLHYFLKSPLPEMPGRPMVFSAVGFIGCQMILEFCGHVFTADAQALFLYYFCALMYTATNYIMLIAISQMNRYRQDNADMQTFINNKMQYYQMSRDGITSLQIKCHDLKHQIAAIRSQADKADFDRYLNRLEDSIIEYGTVVECGNETINIVLTEKNILCSTRGVKFSYIIDGTLFDFMSEMEIYSLFGNALDNALEGCSKVEDPERRVISLKASTRGGMVVLHVENFFDEELTIVDGMPVTTKDGAGHGYGLRSIQQVAEKYGGVASVQAEDHIFKLTVLMNPFREQQT